MRLTRLLLLPVLAAGLMLATGCSDKTDVNVIRKTGVPIEGSQEVPAKAGSGNGLADLEYNKDTRTLFYKITWNSLTGGVTAAHIHGLAKRGFNAGILQTFSGVPATVAGTYSGSVFIDGVVFREADLLAGEYYINIHTAANPGGEIRAQIEF